MSENKKTIYDKAPVFTVVALIVVLIGTIITVFVPLMTDAMHPKLENPVNAKENGDYNYSILQLAGRDVYQKEGCNNCHTQTVRPLKADVLRYGEISQPGESAYERPFLWGSKRTGPDLSRLSGMYSDDWHKAHLINPQAFYPTSNMPKYPWLETKKIDVEEMKKHADALKIPYTDAEIKELENATELDAMVAYLQKLGSHVTNTHSVKVDEEAFMQINTPKTAKIDLDRARVLYDTLCIGCHGETGQKSIDKYTLTSIPFSEIDPNAADGELFVYIANGMEGVMPAHLKIMTQDEIWSLVALVKQIGAKNAAK